MSRLLIIFVALTLISCGSSNGGGEEEGSFVQALLEDVSILTMEPVDGPTSIADYAALAKDEAANSYKFDKGNIKEMLREGMQYRKAIIIVGDHTLVVVNSFADCKPSGSWGGCMPLAKGYIKKGKYVYQEDYINNIIGRPDDQKRVVYFFE